MVLTQFPRLKNWLIRFIILMFSCILIFWAGAHLFVPGFIKKSASEFGTKIGYDIGYQDLSISPLRLKVELDGFHLTKPGGSKLLEFKKLVITAKWTKLVLGELGFDDILLVEPRILIEKKLSKGAHSGSWNWQELIGAIVRNLPHWIRSSVKSRQSAPLSHKPLPD